MFYIALSFKISSSREFPRGPMGKNPPTNAADAVLITSLGTKIPHAVWQVSLRSPEEPLHH